MWYVSSDMDRDRFFCHFEQFFVLLPLTTQKIKIWRATDRIFSHFKPFFALSPPSLTTQKIFKKEKKLEISFNTSAPKIMIIQYAN